MADGDSVKSKVRTSAKDERKRTCFPGVDADAVGAVVRGKVDALANRDKSGSDEQRRIPLRAGVGDTGSRLTASVVDILEMA